MKLLLSLLMLPLLCSAQYFDGTKIVIKDDSLTHNVKFVGKRFTWHSTYQMHDKNIILKKLYTCPQMEFRNNFDNRYNFTYNSVSTIAFDLLLNSSKNYVIYFYIEFSDESYEVFVYDIYVVGTRDITATHFSEQIYDYPVNINKKGSARLSAQLRDFFEIDHNKLFE